MLPKVSVLLPTYQHREFIAECLDGVLVQDYPNLEIVVGDDGSTDGTVEIVRQYAARDPARFKLLLSPVNTGMTANVNRVLAACTGEFRAHLSGDDVWLPGKLHAQIQWFAENPDAVLCYTNAEIFESETGRTLRLQHEPRRNPFRSGGVEQFFVSASFFNGSTALVRAAATPPGGYDERLQLVSDWLFLMETARFGRIGFLPTIFTRYRMHANNASGDVDAILKDQLLAVDLAESKYPDLVALGKRFRAELITASALRCIRAGRYKDARRRFATALRISPLGTSYAPFPINIALSALGLVHGLRLVPSLDRVARRLRR